VFEDKQNLEIKILHRGSVEGCDVGEKLGKELGLLIGCFVGRFVG
jgi:hypothetical protein